jgi:hypothetical protein
MIHSPYIISLTLQSILVTASSPQYWSVLSPVLGENEIKHFPDSPHTSIGLPYVEEISERVLFQIIFKLRLIA